MSRLDKVNSQLKREISRIIHQEMADPRFEFVTILAVDVSKDLQHAKVFFSVLGNAAKVKLAQQGLDHAQKIIRRKIAASVVMRYIPEFMFIYDQSTEFGARIEQTLEEIKNELKKRPAAAKEE